ncbi:hypothetical protein Ancab_033057 [Ancistrocladus abbreviatus]
MAESRGQVGKEQREEALRLKAIAEEKFKSSNLKSALKYAKKAHRFCPTVDGVSEMLTAYKTLHVAAKSKSNHPSTSMRHEWYEILGLEPFSHINTIKKQYKQLALTLHPDKNSIEGSEEAFKLVNDAFQVLSDKIRRKEYDMKLRIALQEQVAEGLAMADVEEVGIGRVSAMVEKETFWTACSRCRLLHKFERQYVGHDLVCPNCKKSFKAVEVGDGGDDCDEEEHGTMEEEEGVRRSGRIRFRSGIVGKSGHSESNRKSTMVDQVLERGKAKGAEVPKSVDGRSKIVDERSRVVNKKRALSGIVEELERVRASKRAKVDEELTLAEIRQKMKEDKKRVKPKEVRSIGKEAVKLPENGDMVVMTVEDSDFYDFDKDRVEKSFKKGQIWAIYDDDDGMPRHYGLIDEVVSVNPFEVKMSWLDLQHKGDERLMCWEKMGFHVSCGRFKVARKDTVNLVNIFSHMVECERAAREVYRIYPKKGSVWALYNERALDMEERNSLGRDKRCYDIVIFLTSYNEMYGLSMAYLEKAEGFKSVFRRRETGIHAIRWLEKVDTRMFSHQIPAIKLSGYEAPDHLKECWELDPASLPPELLSITGER